MAALKRLKRVLSIKYLQAEKLLTFSALTHEHGKESYSHALALGKYFKYGARVEDGADTHRVYLQKQLQKVGYSAAQVELAIADLEPSLGILNVTAMEVQGWLVRQALAYNQQQRQSEPHIQSRDACCGQKVNKQLQFRKAEDLLRACGMSDVAEELQQAAQGLAQLKIHATTPAQPKNSNPNMLHDTVEALQQEGQHEDPHWNKPPAVKQFLLARQSLNSQMQLISTDSPAQLSRTFSSLIATWPTFLEAVQRFPSACRVKYELSEFLQRQIENQRFSIHELELGRRMFLADLIERSTDQIVQQLDGCSSRKLVEAELTRAYKRCGDSNEAVQYVVKTLRAPKVPTPSWREVAGNGHDTPKTLGAAYRLAG
jgi:hypothetical protein